MISINDANFRIVNVVLAERLVAQSNLKILAKTIQKNPDINIDKFIEKHFSLNDSYLNNDIKLYLLKEK